MPAVFVGTHMPPHRLVQLLHKRTCTSTAISALRWVIPPRSRWPAFAMRKGTPHGPPVPEGCRGCPVPRADSTPPNSGAHPRTPAAALPHYLHLAFPVSSEGKESLLLTSGFGIRDTYEHRPTVTRVAREQGTISRSHPGTNRFATVLHIPG